MVLSSYGGNYPWHFHAESAKGCPIYTNPVGYVIKIAPRVAINKSSFFLLHLWALSWLGYVVFNFGSAPGHIVIPDYREGLVMKDT